jgi:poly(A) polymerase
MLSEMEEVTELHPVPDAHVPVMKFKFNGVSVDLLYARLALWVIPEVSHLCKNNIYFGINNCYFVPVNVHFASQTVKIAAF